MNQQQSESTMDRYVWKPTVVGAVGYGMSKAVLPMVFDPSWNQTLNLTPDGVVSKITGQTSLSVPVATAVAVMLGSIVAEFAHEAVFSHIHYLDKASDKTTLLTAGAVAGGSMAAALNVANPGSVARLGLPSIIAAGLGAELIGDMVWSKVKK
jgi:hypothetical protein